MILQKYSVVKVFEHKLTVEVSELEKLKQKSKIEVKTGTEIRLSKIPEVSDSHDIEVFELILIYQGTSFSNDLEHPLRESERLAGAEQYLQAFFVISR